MQIEVLPIFLFAACAVLLSVGLLALGRLIGPRRGGAVKEMPYESGMDPIHDARRRFDVRFHLVAIAFLVFDVELVVPLSLGGGQPESGRHQCGRRCRPGCQPRPGVRRGHGVHRAVGRRIRLRLAERGVPMALELPENVVVSKLDALANWCRKNSLWPMPFATACCGIELMATGASRHDLARFGAEVFRFSPRQCDLMIVAGRVVMKMLPVLQRIWLQMPEPKWCISMGAVPRPAACSTPTAWCRASTAFMPVDMYVPGCPPRPEQLIQSIIDLQDKIQRKERSAAASSPRALARSRSGRWSSCRS